MGCASKTSSQKRITPRAVRAPSALALSQTYTTQPSSRSGRAARNPESWVPARGWLPAKRSPSPQSAARAMTGALTLQTSVRMAPGSRLEASLPMRSRVGPGGTASTTSSAPRTARTGESATSETAEARRAATPSPREGE
jgi:hypothetical protein